MIAIKKIEQIQTSFLAIFGGAQGVRDLSALNRRWQGRFKLLKKKTFIPLLSTRPPL